VPRLANRSSRLRLCSSRRAEVRSLSTTITAKLRSAGVSRRVWTRTTRVPRWGWCNSRSWSRIARPVASVSCTTLANGAGSTSYKQPTACWASKPNIAAASAVRLAIRPASLRQTSPHARQSRKTPRKLRPSRVWRVLKAVVSAIPSVGAWRRRRPPWPLTGGVACGGDRARFSPLPRRRPVHPWTDRSLGRRNPLATSKVPCRARPDSCRLPSALPRR